MEEGQIQEWLTAGITVLSPKNEHNERIKNYIHVICLTTIQKTLHYNEPNISKYTNVKNPMTRKKKRCFRGPKECKEQIQISK